MIVFSLGRPGSGKSTLSKTISLTYGLDLVGTGDVARELAKTDEETRLALEVGNIAPPLKMRNAVLEKIKDNTMIDGFPRYFEQLTDLFLRINQIGVSINDVFFVYTMQDVDVCVERLAARGRADDKISQIVNRMNTFQQATIPVLDYLFGALKNQLICVPPQSDQQQSVSIVRSVLGRHFQVMSFNDGADTLVRPVTGAVQ